MQTVFLSIQEFLGSGDIADRKSLLRKKADWACDINEPRAAAEMYLSAGDTLKAIEIIADNGWIDMLVIILTCTDLQHFMMAAQNSF